MPLWCEIRRMTKPYLASNASHSSFAYFDQTETAQPEIERPLFFNRFRFSFELCAKFDLFESILNR